MARHGKTWQEMARYDKIWRDVTRYDEIWRDMTRYDKTKNKTAGYDKTLYEMVRYEKTWHDMTKMTKIEIFTNIDNALQFWTILMLLKRLLMFFFEYINILYREPECPTLNSVTVVWDYFSPPSFFPKKVRSNIYKIEIHHETQQKVLFSTKRPCLKMAYKLALAFCSTTLSSLEGTPGINL